MVVEVLVAVAVVVVGHTGLAASASLYPLSRVPAKSRCGCGGGVGDGGGGGGAYGPCRKRAARRARRLMTLIFFVQARYVIMLLMSVSPCLLVSVSASLHTRLL